MNTRKYMIRGGLYVILLQAIGGSLVFFVVYNNYQSITTSESIKETYKKSFSISTPLHNTAPELNTSNSTGEDTTSDNLVYSGVFGIIESGKRTLGTNYDSKTINYENISIKTNLHDSSIYIISAFTSGIIDTPVSHYLIKKSTDTNTFEQVVNDLNFLTKYTKKEAIKPPTENIRNKLDSILYQKNNIKTLIKYFEGLESELKTILISDNISPWSNRLLTSNQFAYVFNMIHVDKLGMYDKHFTLASQVFGINQNIVKASIMVEQLRAFYTFKGLFKSVANTNKYLTIMSKQSFGIGGMKLTTAEKLEQWLQQNEPALYDKYFAYANTKNIYQQRLARLTDSKNYYYQVMYSAGLLYWYNTEWKRSGYDLSYNPGILATMYNIGFSEPHAGADIGGASLRIEGDKYSFGGLAMLIYYYLEIFS